MISCKEAVRILASDESISWARRLELQLHLFLCRPCAGYMKHLTILGDAFRKLFRLKMRVERVEVEAVEKRALAGFRTEPTK